MASCFLTQDVLAICLAVADGDLDLSIAEVIARAERYQEAANRYFGISKEVIQPAHVSGREAGSNIPHRR